MADWSRFSAMLGLFGVVFNPLAPLGVSLGSFGVPLDLLRVPLGHFWCPLGFMDGSLAHVHALFDDLFDDLQCFAWLLSFLKVFSIYLLTSPKISEVVVGIIGKVLGNVCKTLISNFRQ